MILSGLAGGDDKSRLLACQFASKFIGLFPDSASTCITAMFKLLAGEDVSVRRQALRSLTAVVKAVPEQATAVGTKLVTFLTVEDATELETINATITTFMADHPQELMTALLEQCLSKDEVLRVASSKKLWGEIRQLARKKEMTPELETLAKEWVMDHWSQLQGEQQLFAIRNISQFSIIKDSNAETVTLVQKIMASTKLQGALKTVAATERLIQALKVMESLLKKKTIRMDRSISTYCIEQVFNGLGSVEESQRMAMLHTVVDACPIWHVDEARTAVPILLNLLQAEVTGAKDSEEVAGAKSLDWPLVEALLTGLYNCATLSPGVLNHVAGTKIVTGQPRDVFTGDSAPLWEAYVALMEVIQTSATVYGKSLSEAEKALNATELPEDETEKLAAKEVLKEKRKTVIAAKQQTHNIGTLTALLKAKTPKLHQSFNVSWRRSQQNDKPKGGQGPANGNKVNGGGKKRPADSAPNGNNKNQKKSKGKQGNQGGKGK